MTTDRIANQRSSVRLFFFGLFVAGSMLISSCVSNPQRQTVRVPEQRETSALTPIYFYPNHGQSAMQQDRDRYECHLWAVQQTGFDPSSVSLAPHQRVVVVPQPPEGHDTAVGTVAGALIGAVAGAPHHTAEGAAIGAVTGAVIGSSSDAARREQAEAEQDRYDSAAARKAATIERRAENYRRAMQACLEGRGYTVR